jgi:NarL family two-component system response regulator LiaR
MSEQQEKIRVLIVDDHQVVRQGLSTFLGLRPEIVVVGEAADGRAAVEMAGRLTPDVVLMDLVMPELDGIAATRQIRAHHPHTQVIVLTSFTEDEKVIPAIQAGAASYLLKDVTPDALVEAILAVHRGEARLHPDIARKLMARVAQGPAAPRDTAGALESLTTRELEVIRLVARGRSNQDIARELVISEKTVKTHVSNVLSKLNLEDRTQLAIHAIKSGLMGED